MSKQPLIPPNGKVNLADYDPSYSGGFTSQADVQSMLDKDLLHLIDRQEVLYAEAKHALLIVVQAMDTGGKDGLIAHVFRGLNPAGVEVVSFKAPTSQELSHDFLWRVHQHAPAKGLITVFNRSHYEDVLVARVHNLVPKDVWKARYDQINVFEALLTASGTTILKFFLYISKDEQKRRLDDRLKQPEKHWKFNTGDLVEREHWDEYMEAYEALLSKCNPQNAPWHIVPANHKWYRNYIVTQTIVAALENMKMSYPPPAPGLDKVVVPD